MRLNRYLASTLFTGLFVTASIFTPPAMGQEQSLKPQGKWAVTKIDRAAQGGQSYCTLSRKYDNGAVLSLGRNITEEYSIAIDFQKQAFEKGKSLKINLQPGPGQIRAYDMMPASEKAVVVRLGWDTGFFDALNKSQQMKVKIADKDYAFALPEIAKGQQDLTECMEGLKEAAKSAKGGNQTAAASKDVLNADPKANKAFDAGKVDDKVTTAAAMPQTNAMPTAATPAPRGPDDVAQNADVEAQEKSVLDKFAANMRTQEEQKDAAPAKRNFASKGDAADAKPRGGAVINIGDEDAPDAAQKVAEAKTPIEPPPSVAQKAPELVKRPAPSPVVETAKEAAKEAAPAPAPAAAKMAAVSPAAAFEKDEAAQKALQKQIDDLKAQNQALQQKAGVPAQTQQQLAAVQSEKAALQQRLDAMQKDKASAPKPEEVANLQTRIKELEAKNAQLEDSLRQAQVRIGETAINTETKSIRRIAELESKLQAAQDDNNALAKQLESFRTQQEDKALSAVAGDWNLEQATKRYNEAEREIRRLGLQLEQERTSCNREKAQIEQMLFDPAVADQKQIERLTQLESQLDEAQAKIANTQKMVQDQVNQQVAAQVAQKTQTLEAQKAGMDAQVSNLQKSLADRDATIASLQKTATDAQAQANAAQTAVADKTKLAQQIADMQKSMAAKDQELAALKAQPKADPAQVAALQAQIKSMGDAMVSKDKAIADAQAQANAAQAATADKAKMAQQIADLQRATAAKDQELAALKAQPKADPAQVTALQAQIKAMSDAMAAKDKAVADAQAAAKAAQLAAAQPKTDPAVMKQIADLQSAMTSVKADNDALRDQNIILRQDADKLRLQLSDAATNGGARADQVASLQLQIDTLKRQAATKDTQLATYQNQLASLQQESAQLKNRLSVSDSSRSASTDEVGALTRQIQQLQSQVDSLQAQKARAPDRSAMADTYNGITPAAGYVSPAPVARVQAQPVAMTAGGTPTGAAMSGYDKGAIQSLLQKSGLNINGVSKASSGFAGADNFSWTDSSNVKGLASVKMLSGASFDTMVSQYIAYQKGLCGGDFASMPSPTNGSAAKNMSLYEVACVGANGNESASLLFFEDQGRFIAIANQIQAADMDLAMDSRDKIAGFVRGL